VDVVILKGVYIYIYTKGGISKHIFAQVGIDSEQEDEHIGISSLHHYASEGDEVSHPLSLDRSQFLGTQGRVIPSIPYPAPTTTRRAEQREQKHGDCSDIPRLHSEDLPTMRLSRGNPVDVYPVHPKGGRKRKHESAIQDRWGDPR
jgi:hypothetical protein